MTVSTVVVSEKGWVRARQGHGHEAGAFAFKAGDALYATFECRSVDQLIGNALCSQFEGQPRVAKAGSPRAHSRFDIACIR